MRVEQDTKKTEGMQAGAPTEPEKLDALALLEQIERQVKLPMLAARRRRFWLAWTLWGVFGAAVTWSGAPQGAALAMASILTAPLWLLFLAWPVLWIRDRWRARQLWAEDVRLLVEEVPENDAEPQEDPVALPVIVGRDHTLVVPLDGWCTVFPEISREALVRLGVEVWPAEKLSGVALDVMPAEALVAAVTSHSEKLSQTAMTAAQRWVACLKKALS